MTDSVSTLEGFFLRYIEHAGGVWDEIEPQVYDLLLPDQLEQVLGARVTFDPEALQDHPSAQLMAFGNPALDAIFEQAQTQHRVAQVYLGGLNLTPHNLTGLVQRGLQVPQGTTLTMLSQHPLHYHSALWWFQATFVSDEKVQETYAIGIDLHYGRITRHLEEFLDQEPWHSLAVDNDITVTLATIEDLLERMTNGEPWYHVSPQLPATLANLMDRVDREQFMRFAGELTNRQLQVRNAAEQLGFLNEIITAGAHRVGVRPPAWLQASA